MHVSTRARAVTLEPFRPSNFHAAPPLVDSNTPSSVPANRSVPNATREYTSKFVRPEFIADQLVPWLVDRNTPPPHVPAIRFESEAANARTHPPSGPLACTHWALAPDGTAPRRMTMLNTEPRIDLMILLLVNGHEFPAHDMGWCDAEKKGKSRLPSEDRTDFI